MGNDNLSIRPFQSSDSVEDLTALFHRAYNKWADRGLHFVATHQTPEMTRRLLTQGGCHVAIIDEKIVGTVLFWQSSALSGCAWFDCPEVCGLGKFAVDPKAQGHGVGRALMRLVESRARETGASELALDTAEPAHELVEMYQRWGFRIVDRHIWPEVNYPSVIMSKSLIDD